MSKSGRQADDDDRQRTIKFVEPIAPSNTQNINQKLELQDHQKGVPPPPGPFLYKCVLSY